MLRTQITQQTGAPAYFDSTYCTTIGGYPLGALLESTNVPGWYWRSTADNNTTNPDSAAIANWAQQGRAPINTNLTKYVSTTGSDSTGLGTVGSPWQTIQHAVNILQNNYDIAQFNATIQVADGTYSAGAAVTGKLIGQAGPANLLIQGNVSSPGNVIINMPAGMAFTASQVAGFQVQGFQIQGSYEYGLAAWSGGIILFQNIVFAGTCSVAHRYTDTAAAMEAIGNYTISSGAQFHMQAASAGVMEDGSITVTLTGTPNFGAYTASTAGIIVTPGITFVGSATGSRYVANLNGIINTNGAGANYYPGNTAGATQTGGQYV